MSGGNFLAQAAQSTVGVPTLEVFGARLDGALGRLSCWMAALPTAEGGRTG